MINTDTKQIDYFNELKRHCLSGEIKINKTAQLMSFIATKKQIYKKEKTVTRRLGWKSLKIGNMLWAVEQCQGVGKGNKVKRIWYILVLDTRWEPLKNITQADCIKEGFPELSPSQFVDMFCQLNKAKKCTPDTLVNRIEFCYPMYVGEAYSNVVPDEQLQDNFTMLATIPSEYQEIYKNNVSISLAFGMNDKTRRRYVYR